MNHVQVRRMKRIIAHLRNKKLVHKKFDFAIISKVDWGGKPGKNGCGTSGCAMGEYPAIFPSLFKWRVSRYDNTYTIDVQKRGGDQSGLLPWHQAQNAAFLGITANENETLFYPGSQYTHNRKPGTKALGLKGVKNLGARATAKQVAQNMENFLKAKGLW